MLRERLRGGIAWIAWAAAAASLKAWSRLAARERVLLRKAARRCESRAAAAAKGTRRPPC